MLGALLRQDLKVLLRDRSLALVLGMALLAVFYATWSGSVWKGQQHVAFVAAQEELRQAAEREAGQLAALEEGTLTVAEAPAAGLPNSVKTVYLQPPGPLEEFAIGNADLRPRKADIAAMGRADDMFRNYQIDNPALLSLGRFDLAFFTVYVLPLLLLGLSFSVLSADRESGALALLLSQPLTAGQLAVARILFRSGILILTVIAGTMVAWLVFLPQTASPASPGRLLAWALVTLIYGAFWAALAVLVVARNGSSERNALVLLLAWIGFTLLLPALTGLLAQTFSPVPSRLAYITTARAAENDANSQASALLQGYLLDHPEIEATTESAVAPYVKNFVLVQQRVEQAVAPVAEVFERQLDRQQAINGTLALLSPASLAQRALAELAGTSLARQRRYEAEARALRATWLEALQPPIIAGRRLSSTELAALPRPEFMEASAGQLARSLGGPLLLLLAYGTIIALLARRRFRRFSLLQD